MSIKEEIGLPFLPPVLRSIFFLSDKIILGYPFKTEAQFPRRCQGAANIASRMFSHGMWFLLSLVLVGVSRWKQEGVLDPGPGL